MIGKIEKRCEPEFGDPGFRIRAFILLPSPLFFLFSLFPFSLYRSYVVLFSFLAQPASRRLAFVGVWRLAYGIVAYGMSIQFLMLDVNAGCWWFWELDRRW